MALDQSALIDRLLFAAGWAHTRRPVGGFNMTIPQEQLDDLLSRAALAALFYYPEIAVDDGDFNLQKDIAYCLEPVAGIADEDAERLRVAVGHVITNPTAHRSELLALVIELAPQPPE